MMRLLKIAKSGPKNRPSDDDAAGKPEAEDEPTVDIVTDESGDEVESAEPKAGPGEDPSVDLDTEIASILATIRSRKLSNALPDIDLPEDTGATYQLLSELDRLWRSA